MSKCISSRGEYSDHEFGGDAPEFVCCYCWSFDEDAALAEITRLRGQVAAVEKLADLIETSCDFTYGGVCGTHGCDVEDYRGQGRECAQVADLRAALEGGAS